MKRSPGFIATNTTITLARPNISQRHQPYPERRVTTNAFRPTSSRIAKDVNAKPTSVCTGFTIKEKGTPADFDQATEISGRETKRPAGAAHSGQGTLISVE